MNRKIQINGVLLGFRSGVPYKKILAVLYYGLWLFGFVCMMVTPPLVEAGLRDRIILRCSVIILAIGMISPVFFLSNTSFRDRVPFFRKKNPLDSFGGFIIVAFMTLVLFNFSERLHTPEYRTSFNTYIEQTYGFDATGQDLQS